jgi:hypothetical protein
MIFSGKGAFPSKAQVETAFKELRFAVDGQDIVPMHEGLYTLAEPDRIWTCLGRLARLLWAVRKVDLEIGASFEAMTWGIARWQLITDDDGKPALLGANDWHTARDRFATILNARPG